MTPQKDAGARVLVGLVTLVALLAMPGLARSLFGGGADGRWEASEMVAVTAIAALVVGAVLLALTPFFGERLITLLSSHPAWAGAVLGVMTTHKVSTREVIEGVFADTLATREADRERLRTLEERQRTTDATIQSAARALEAVPLLQNGVEKLTAAVERLDEILTRVSDESQQQGKDVAHMRGILDTVYPGPERRHGDRRRGA